MKKTIIMMLTAALLLCALVSCDSESSSGIDLSGVDSDFTIINNPYETLLSFMTNPQDYQGKTIAVNAISSVVYNFDKNRVDQHIMLGLDPTGCCNALYEIRADDGKYPNIGADTTFVGNFTSDGYIHITDFETADTAERQYDIDALSMNASELNSFIAKYIEQQSESQYFEQKIRIFGHVAEASGYKYLLGLDSNGYQTWIIELYDPTGSLSFPVVSGNLVNPAEIIGTLSVYCEDGTPYACITVEHISKVECVFS